MPERMTRKGVRLLATRALTVAGIVLVLGAFLTMSRSPVLVGVVVLGLLLVEVGVWRLADPVLQDQRRYLALRREMDDFLSEVRALNDHAVAGDPDAVEEHRERLHHRVDAIFDAAGATHR